MDQESNAFLQNLKMSSEVDQAIEGSKLLAKIVRAYYQNLRDEGFNAVEALALSTQYQARLLAGNQPNA